MDLEEITRLRQPISPDDPRRTERLATLYHNPAFPRSSRYDPLWVLENARGPQPLWLLEWLCEILPLQPGWKVLDLGCGTAMTSIFLAREFNVHVWAADANSPSAENLVRVCDTDLLDRVQPVQMEARALQFPHAFFDAVICVDSYTYYGLYDAYPGYLQQFVRDGGWIGVSDLGMMQEFDGSVPDHLTCKHPDGYAFYEDGWCCHHTPDWWRRHWEQCPSMEVIQADAMPDGWLHWLHDRMVQHYAHSWPPEDWPMKSSEARTLIADAGRYVGFVRVAVRKRGS